MRFLVMMSMHGMYAKLHRAIQSCDSRAEATRKVQELRAQHPTLYFWTEVL